jgi:hypothetical protein
MSREQERRREELAGQLSQALDAAAELMTQRIQAASTRSGPAPAARRARGRRSGRLRGWMHGWLVPLAAATAVAAIATGSLLVSRIHFGAAQPSSTTTTGVPAFCLTLGGVLQQIEVHRTSDGTLSSARGWNFGSMSAAASDRTFFVPETPAENSINSCPADRFLRFSVTATGRVTDPRQVGAQVNGTELTLAASPDGTRLACYACCGASTVWGLHVMNLASGAVSTWTSTWTGSVNTTGPADVSGPGQLAWTGDGRSLALGYEWKGSSQACEAYQAVLLLNIGSGSARRSARTGRA